MLTPPFAAAVPECLSHRNAITNHPHRPLAHSEKRRVDQIGNGRRIMGIGGVNPMNFMVKLHVEAADVINEHTGA